MRILLAQINTTVGDFVGNKEKILEGIAKAHEAKADLLTFPELTLTGYPPEDLLFRESFVTANIRLLESLAKHTQGLCVVLGFVDRDKKGNIFNAAAVIRDKKILCRYHKIYLPNYGVFDEKRYFVAGNQNTVVNINGARLGLTICEDIWHKESWVYRPVPRGDILSMLINISASPYHLGKQKERQGLIRQLAIKHRCPVIYQNLVGGQDELVFDGGSLVIGARGQILAQANNFKEEYLAVDLPIAGVKNTRRPRLERRRFHSLPRIQEEVYQALVLGTRDYIHKNGFTKVLVGLSGGIDSALVGCIAVDALGAEQVIGVTMPSPYTSKETYLDAKLLAKNLGIQCQEFSIHDIFSSYLLTLKDTFASYRVDITEENLQARIRGNLLMALSNKFHYLVLTTGNKSEMATGYCTLYGDMAGGFAVIKDVPKTLVFKLAYYRNTLTRKNCIPTSVIKRAPTAELRHGQKDQDTLPPYRLLDKFLELYVEEGMALNQIVKRGIPKKIAVSMAKKVDDNEYKRRQAPPGIKITPLAFGRDRRMPITKKDIHC